MKTPEWLKVFVLARKELERIGRLKLMILETQMVKSAIRKKVSVKKLLKYLKEANYD